MPGVADAIEVLEARIAPAHAALGFAHDVLDDAVPALASFRTARRLDPKDRVVDVFVPTILERLGRERDALRDLAEVARRQRVDLKALKRELVAARVPVTAGNLLFNGFIHARNFFRSHLADEEERILNALDRGRARREAAAERARCAEDQRALAARFDASRVPESLRALSPWASRFGIGDDVCRPRLLQALPKAKRAELIRAVDAHAARAQAWLDTFRGGKMSAEAAAFLYLMEGIEEIR